MSVLYLGPIEQMHSRNGWTRSFPIWLLITLTEWHNDTSRHWKILPALHSPNQLGGVHIARKFTLSNYLPTLFRITTCTCQKILLGTPASVNGREAMTLSVQVMMLVTKVMMLFMMTIGIGLVSAVRDSMTPKIIAIEIWVVVMLPRNCLLSILQPICNSDVSSNLSLLTCVAITSSNATTSPDLYSSISTHFRAGAASTPKFNIAALCSDTKERHYNKYKPWSTVTFDMYHKLHLQMISQTRKSEVPLDRR